MVVKASLTTTDWVPLWQLQTQLS